MKGMGKQFFCIVSSTVDPSMDYIYECHTDLCIRVTKRTLILYDCSGRQFICRADNKYNYAFELIGNMISNYDDILAAVKWYFSHIGAKFEKL